MTKKKSKPPKPKKLKQQDRLLAAKTWIPQYSGKNLVRGYSKYFRVNPLDAVEDLKMLGIDTDPEYIAKLKDQMKRTQQAKEEQKRRRQQSELMVTVFDDDQNADFYFIAGYTPNGVPFGLTWEEYVEDEKAKYYYIAGYDEHGEIIGLKWDEFLRLAVEDGTGDGAARHARGEEKELYLFLSEGDKLRQ